MTEKTYTQVVAQLEESKEYPDVHLEVLGMKLDLPNLNSANIPIELAEVVLLLRSQPVQSEEIQAQATAVFLAYFRTIQPNFWAKLRGSDQPLAYLAATIKAWADQSGLDPKALP